LDERGDGVADWTIGLSITMKGEKKSKPIRIDDLHPYEKDRSYRCLHINLTDAKLDDPLSLDNIEFLTVNLFMSTNSSYLVYNANKANRAKPIQDLKKGVSEFSVDLAKWVKPEANDAKFALLVPYTTTFLEFRVNRDPSESKNHPKLVKILTSIKSL
jgi:hypothetical protein